MTDRRIAMWTSAAALWTFIAWGSRIGLLTGPEADDPWTWIRVGGSLLFGVLLTLIAAMLWFGRPFASWMATAFIAFAALMLVIWIRSAFIVLTDDETIVFKTIHIVLAIISIGLGLVLARVAIRE